MILSWLSYTSPGVGGNLVVVNVGPNSLSWFSLSRKPSLEPDLVPRESLDPLVACSKYM